MDRLIDMQKNRKTDKQVDRKIGRKIEKEKQIDR